MIYVTSCSGGKDSCASLILENRKREELGFPPSDVVFINMMFDKTKDISLTDPWHYEFIQEKLKPWLERNGHKFIELKSDIDYIDCFMRVVKRSKNHPERNGKLVGFPCASYCNVKRDIKVKCLNLYAESLDTDTTQIIGIRIDEIHRLNQLNDTKISLLAQYKQNKYDVINMCLSEGLYSPIYTYFSRDGCWCCPNKPISYFAYIKLYYPHYWNSLLDLADIPNKVSEYFSYNRDLYQVDQMIDKYLLGGFQLKIEI